VNNILKSLLPHKVCLKASEGELQISEWVKGKWEPTTRIKLPKGGSRLWLVSEQNTQFQYREYPADVVGSSGLEEAVLLDLEAWSPWGRLSGYFFFSKKEKNQWQVAVWVWDQTQERRSQEVASNITITHVMPEQAFQVLSCPITEGGALLLRTEKNNNHCILINEQGVPTQQTVITTAAEGVRFKRSIGRVIGSLNTVFTINGDEPLPAWLPEIEQKRLQLRPPKGKALSQARLDGSYESYDPFKWKKPVIALLVLWLIYLLGQSFILWSRTSEVESKLQEERVLGKDLLVLRDKVRVMHTQIKHNAYLRQRQSREMILLAQLTQRLPLDAWLLSVVIDNKWASIQGKALDAASIGAALEGLAGIDHIAYEGEIKLDPATQRQAFHIKLHFSGSDS